MTFLEAIRSGFRKYWSVEGRASRSQYWYWALFTVLATLALIPLDNLIFDTPLESGGPLGVLFTLATFFPSLFLGARRLHDVDRSAHWMLISLTIIGIIPLIYWAIIKGTVGDNRFGPDPLAEKPTAA